jgi:hypothetical protein
MSPSLQDFALSISLDCGILRRSLAAGEQIPPAEILSLASAAEAIFITATLESRQLDRVRDCHQLWSRVAELFGELTQTWVDVTSDDANIVWLRGRLTHFMELALDRMELYQPEGADRKRLVANKREADAEHSFSTRGEIVVPT